MMLDIHDLPGPAVRSITRRVRPRIIPGTNRFALVCRTWRDASNVDEEDVQLQLELDLDDLSEPDLATSLSWLQLHGSSVSGLAVHTVYKPCWSIMEQTLVASALCSSQLTRLELMASDTLLPLAPHLPHLPHLQHLSASIWAKIMQQEGVASFCTDGGKCVEEPPDLGQLCPQLVSLELTMEGWDKASLLSMPTADARLCRLLPTTLQQLRLATHNLRLDCSALKQLTALTKLVIESPSVFRWGLQELTALRELELNEPMLGMEAAAMLAPYASQLVRLQEVFEAPAGFLQQLTCLTALSLHVKRAPEGPEAVNPLTALASLHSLQLDLGYYGEWIMEGLTRISSLRCLALQGIFVGAEAVELPGQVTQLTQLAMSDAVHDSVDAQVESLQQLTGLVQLKINQHSFGACGGLLGALQHLKVLFVTVYVGEGASLPPVEELVAPLQSQPPSLQHLVFECGRAKPFWSPEVLQLPQEVVPSPVPGVRVTVCWGTVPRYVAHALGPMRPCPHLAGVWELVPEV